MTETHTPLSWSRVAVYRQCPRQYEAKFLTKEYPDESDNPAFAKGNAVHSQLEAYIKALKGSKVKPVMGTIATNLIGVINSYFKRIDANNIHAEKQLAVDLNYKSVGWFTADIKWRAIIDMLVETRADRLHVNDFKTGKVRDYDDDRGQLHLTAVLLFELYPKVNQITCAYLFAEHKETRTVVFHREDHAKNKAAFDLEWLSINEDTDFKAVKNKYCYFCGIKEQCEFG